MIELCNDAKGHKHLMIEREIRMSDVGRTSEINVESLSLGAREIIQHLCESDCRTFGSVMQWCETRGDCVYIVRCPGCTSQYVIDEDDLCALEAWTRNYGQMLVCGVRDVA